MSWNKRPVLCMDSGERYDSALDAARALVESGMDGDPLNMTPNIRRACSGGVKTAYGHTWRYDGEPARMGKAEPAGMYGLTGLRMDRDEWQRFRAACSDRGMLMRDAGVEAIRMWMEAGDAE